MKILVMSKYFVVFLTLLTIFVFSFTGCNDIPAVTPDPSLVVPEEILTLKNAMAEQAEQSASQLSGKWADDFQSLMVSGKGPEEPIAASLEEKLKSLREEENALSLYVLIPESSDPEYFVLTLDGSPEPDDWLTRFETNQAFLTAWNGTPAAMDRGWILGSESDPCWSAFAPITNSEGMIVAILGIDNLAPEANAFPDWVNTRKRK